MNRRKFVLSWGRKMFFGLSWPLTSILGLIYFKSFILPSTPTEFIYVSANFIGHYGLMNALVYFLLYYPIVFIIPSYYVSRFWSLLLILSLNLFVLIDGVLFSTYLEHSYGLFWKLFLEKGVNFIPDVSGVLVVIAIAMLVSGIAIWLRGERIWRYMQGRFSNPVKNWYLVLIFLSLIISKSVYFYGGVSTNLSSVFPVDLNFNRELIVKKNDNKEIFYPRGRINCTGKKNNNLVLLTIREWGQADLNSDAMPLVHHMKRHAIVYNSHYSTATYPHGGLFSFNHSIPAHDGILDTTPAIMIELKKREYEIVSFLSYESQKTTPKDRDEQTINNFENWINSRSNDVFRPYAINISLDSHPSETDKMIQFVVGSLESKKMLQDTIIVLTGGSAQAGNNFQVPLLIFSPERKTYDVDHVTSHYDIMPTLMENFWGCKDVFVKASIGTSLDNDERDWLLVTSKNGFKIVDFKNSVITTVENGHYYDEVLNEKRGEPNRELILEALKLNIKFTKSR